MAIDLDALAKEQCLASIPSGPVCSERTSVPCGPCVARALAPRVRVLNDLTDYAQHDAGCPATWVLKPGKPCDCGLDDALRALEGL